MSLFPEYYTREVRHKLGLSGPIDVMEVANELEVNICKVHNHEEISHMHGFRRTVPG